MSIDRLKSPANKFYISFFFSFYFKECINKGVLQNKKHL